jgi:two-component system KDP operon response regulator KdpE
MALLLSPRSPEIAPLRVADLKIDALRRRIRQGAREIRLTPGEHTILYTLAAKAGSWVTYREIASALGRPDPALGENNTVARHIYTLRRRLRDDATNPRYIETLDGIGYRLLAA